MRSYLCYSLFAILFLFYPVVSSAGYSLDKQEELSVLAAKGGKASMTVFPVFMQGRTSTDIAEVIGLMFEQAGMEHMSISETHFKAPDNISFDDLPVAFGDFVRKQNINTDYALYAHYVDSVSKGVQETRVVIVGKDGSLVWQDRQTPDDADFKRIKPANPMMCSHLVSQRFKRAIDLKKSPDFKVSQGRMNKLWAAKTSFPDKSELKDLKARCKAMKSSLPEATITVFPPLIWEPKDGKRIERVDTATAVNLARLMQKGKVVAAKDGPVLKVKPARNQMQMLWELARAFRSYLKDNPIDTDYALYAHYLIGFNGKAGGVHTVVCDKSGEWVIVDLQNDHHRDFKAIKPDSLDDCAKLSAKRLEYYLK